jgi:hypothetical protein
LQLSTCIDEKTVAGYVIAIYFAIIASGIIDSRNIAVALWFRVFGFVVLVITLFQEFAM